jgi:16S rRNA (cytosine967-C5)-methyltransferase
VVCSLLPDEGEAQMKAFLGGHKRFEARDIRSPRGGAPVSKVVLTPADDGCDGFFVGGATRLC